MRVVPFTSAYLVKTAKVSLHAFKFFYSYETLAIVKPGELVNWTLDTVTEVDHHKPQKAHLNRHREN